MMFPETREAIGPIMISMNEETFTVFRTGRHAAAGQTLGEIRFLRHWPPIVLVEEATESGDLDESTEKRFPFHVFSHLLGDVSRKDDHKVLSSKKSDIIQTMKNPAPACGPEKTKSQKRSH